MIPLPFFRSSTVKELYRAIDKNLESYRNGNFENLVQDPALSIETQCQIDEEQLLEVHCSREEDNEIACCMAVHKGLKGVTPYLARDERLWVRLSHIELLDYARTRWPIPKDDEKAVAHIKKHFFARGSRGVERDNAISRLWWMAELCSKVEGLALSESLAALLHQSDVRANIIERPSTTQNSKLLSALLRRLHESLAGDKQLFERARFRTLMKRLNIEGGVRLLDVMEISSLQELLDSSAAP